MTGTIDRLVEEARMDDAVADQPDDRLAASDDEVERIARLFGVHASAHRLRLIRQLGDRELDFGQLTDLLGFNQPNVSQHLGRLRHAGVVASDRRGQHVTNRLSTPLVTALCELGCRLAEELDRSHQRHATEEKRDR